LPADLETLVRHLQVLLPVEQGPLQEAQRLWQKLWCANGTGNPTCAVGDSAAEWSDGRTVHQRLDFRSIIGNGCQVGLRVVFGLTIARHSPERFFESELPIEPPEKNRCDESKGAPNVISLVRFLEQISRKPGLLRVFHTLCNRVSLRLRLRGGGKWIRTPDTVGREGGKKGKSRLSASSEKIFLVEMTFSGEEIEV
jgi:hypothetical protein